MDPPVSTSFTRYISVDPGTRNVGVCVLDIDDNTTEQRLVHMGLSELESPSRLRWKHHDERMCWLQTLTAAIVDWMKTRILPWMMDAWDQRVVVVVEENDLAFTRDWAGILAGALLTFDSTLRFVTVIPRVVSKWMVDRLEMPRRSTRAQKKKFTRDLFDSRHPAIDDRRAYTICEHSCDAWLNLQYFLGRQQSRKRKRGE